LLIPSVFQYVVKIHHNDSWQLYSSDGNFFHWTAVNRHVSISGVDLF